MRKMQQGTALKPAGAQEGDEDQLLIQDISTQKPARIRYRKTV
jgi:hypothetical protein